MEIAKDAATLRARLERRAAKTPLKPAILFRTDENSLSRWTYRALLDRIRALGTALLKRDCGGKAMAILGRNSPDWALAYLTVCCGAGVAVPLDRQLLPEEIAFTCKFADVRVLFADREGLEKLAQVRRRLPKKLLIVALDGTEDAHAVSLESLLQEGAAAMDAGDDRFLNLEIDPQRCTVLFFTSGTTDKPKGVMLSDENLCFALHALRQRVKVLADDTTLCVLPLHHAYQNICMLLLLSVGGAVAFCPGLRHVSADLKFFQPTVFVTVPLMLEKMHKRILTQLEKQGRFKRSLASGRMSFLTARFDLKKYVYALIHDAFGGRLRMIVVGAAALDPSVARDFSSFGIPVVLGYGLTECAPVVLCNSSDAPKPDGVGTPLDGLQVILDDADDSGVGELCVRGGSVMLGYYKNKKATAAVLKDGWLRTGDLAYRDDDGDYHITGRKKNIIVTKTGENVYPEELESYLNREPLVLESLIFGEETAGDAVVAVQVVPDEDAIKAHLGKDKVTNEEVQGVIRDVIRRVNRRLPSYKSIRSVFIRDKAIEKTSTQKPKRTPPVRDETADE
ncbi:MAG: AMP-binding protein [Clostridia bacterium]|nr:AMP-binding protein [Clostridia bacterium]